MAGSVAFGPDGWSASGDAFTTERAATVGQAVATWLADFGLTGAPVAVSYDTRLPSRRMARALCEVLTANGIAVCRTAQDRPTPLLAWLVNSTAMSAGLMVTGSGDPPDHNGVKFVTAAGTPPLPPLVDALGDRLAAPRSVPAGERVSTTETTVYDDYAAAVRDLIDTTPITDLRIVYDGIHGTGRSVVPRLLESAGVAVDGRRCTRDPTFRGHPPSPTAAHLGPLTEAVSSTAAELGIATDGDADRIGIVTSGRGRVPDHLLVAALAAFVLERQGGPLVRDITTTGIVDRIARDRGANLIETSQGMPWIASAMREHRAVLGADGHGRFALGGHVRIGDGVATSLLVAAMAAAEPVDRRIGRLLERYGPIDRAHRRIDVPTGPAQAIEVVASSPPESLGGLTVTEVAGQACTRLTLADDSWLLLAPRVDEGQVELTAERIGESGARQLLAALVAYLSERQGR